MVFRALRHTTRLIALATLLSVVPGIGRTVIAQAPVKPTSPTFPAGPAQAAQDEEAARAGLAAFGS